MMKNRKVFKIGVGRRGCKPRLRGLFNFKPRLRGLVQRLL